MHSNHKLQYVYFSGKIVLLDSVIQTIKRDNLLSVVDSAGKVLQDGLKGLEKKYNGKVHSARGIGTFCAIDTDTTAR